MWDIGIKIFPEVIYICTLVNDEVSIPEPLAKLRRRWEGNIKMHLHGIECGWERGLHLPASGFGPVTGYCAVGIKLIGSIECWQILD
jgi:hypothetical protein